MKFKKRDQQRGFTLIEMLVVLVLISLLAGLVGPQLFNKIGSSKTKVASAQIELFTSALNTYRLDVGDYPSTEQGLSVLMSAPGAVVGWDGPYLAKAIPADPWGQTYIYKLQDNGNFALYTLGKDGKEGGTGENEDIGVF